jgi:hypothetical protein
MCGLALIGDENMSGAIRRDTESKPKLEGRSAGNRAYAHGRLNVM